MSSPDLNSEVVQILKIRKSGLVQISEIRISGLVQILKIRKSGLVQIYQNSEIWTSSENIFSAPGCPDSQKFKSGLVQIFKFWQIWTSPDFTILANLD